MSEVFWANYRNVRRIMRETPKAEQQEKFALFRAFQAYGLHAPVVLILRDIANASR